MLTPFSSVQAGYTIIEALVAVVMTSLVTAGLWQLALSARSLASARFIDSQPQCDLPECSAGPTEVVCTCGHLNYVILR